MNLDKQLGILNVNEQEQEQEQEPEPVKKKKGRPRKQVKPDELVPVEKRKRGRKKKEVVVEEVKQKKKRGRKAAVKYFSSSIRKKIPLTTVIPDNNNFILHLNVEDTDNKATSSYDSNKPYYASNINDSKILFEKLKTEDFHVEMETQKKLKEMLNNDQGILLDFIEKNDNEQSEDTLRDLYEERIKFRESQDKALIDKLELLKLSVKDEDFINEQLHPSTSNKEQARVTSQEANRKRGYFHILHKFVQDGWLEKTDVCCWWCCHDFDSIPVGLPIHYDSITRKFRVKGVFCSFACMIAYKNSVPTRQVDYLIKFLYQQLTSESLATKLEPAPPRCTLKMFGGELTIDEFRNSTKEHKIYRMVEYPMIVSRDYIKEVDIANVKNANSKLFDDSSFKKVVSLDEKRVEDAKQRLTEIDKNRTVVKSTIERFIM